MPPLAVSIGDPAGIGPEIIAASWTRRAEANLGPFFVLGAGGLLAAAAKARGLACPIIAIDDPAEAAGAFSHGVPVLGSGDCTYLPGAPDEQGAAVAMQSLAEATRMALRGKAGADFTAPVAKAQLAKVGFEFPGQTEFLAIACGLPAEAAVMMLAGPSLRTVPLTVHCSLAEVPGRLSTDLNPSSALRSYPAVVRK